MSNKKEEIKAEKVEDAPKTCFVIMPISDQPGYTSGHFQRVYDFIIKPACKQAGFSPIRADEVKGTNVIILDILERILSSEMAVCDLSAKNGNVLYELGIRQAFDKPVTVLKDNLTERIFDINTIRDVPYESSLRFDQVNNAVEELSQAIQETYSNKGKELNSIVGLLGIDKAQVKHSQLSNDTQVLLQAINEITIQRSSSLRSDRRSDLENLVVSLDSDGRVYTIGDVVVHKDLGEGRVCGFGLDLFGRRYVEIGFGLKEGSQFSSSATVHRFTNLSIITKIRSGFYGQYI
jgi:hypothetical protein